MYFFCPQELTTENASLKMQLELAKLAEQELAKRNLVYQRSIRSLLAKLKLTDEKTLSAKAAHASMAGAVADYEDRTRDLAVLLQEREHEREALDRALADMRAEVEQWKARQDDVCSLLVGLLGEAKEVLAGASAEGPGLQEEGAEAGDRREGERSDETAEAPSDTASSAAPAPPAAPRQHPLLAAAANAARERIDPSLESIPTLLRVASAESREAAVQLIVTRLQELASSAPSLPSSLSALAAEAEQRGRNMSAGSQGPSLGEPDFGAAAKRLMGGGAQAGEGQATLPPIGGGARASKASSIASAGGRGGHADVAQKLALAGSQYPGVEILMSQIFTDAKSKAWGAKAKTIR